MFGKVMKVVGWILLGILLLLLLLWTALKIPAVQNLVAQKLAKSLSKQLDTQVNVGKVSFSLFKSVEVEEFEVRDQAGDTLLTVGSLNVDIASFDYWNRAISLQDIVLQHVHFHLQKGEVTNNYKFLFDFFSGDSPDTATSTWQLDLNKLKITQSHLSYDNLVEGSKMDLYLGSFIAYIDALDLGEKLLQLRQAAVSESDLGFVRRESSSKLASSDENSEQGFDFPNIGWNIDVQQLVLEDNGLWIDNEDLVRRENYLDYQHLDLDDVGLFVEDIRFYPQYISADIASGQLRDQSGFEVKGLSGQFFLNADTLVLRDLDFNTTQSTLQAGILFDFASGDRLFDWSEASRLYLALSNAAVHSEDLNHLWPGFNELPYINSDLDASILLQGALAGSPNNLQINALGLEIGDYLDLNISGQIKNIQNPSLLKYDLNVADLSTSYIALESITKGLTLPAEIRPWGNFHFQGLLSGNMNELVASELDLRTGSLTGFAGDIQLKDLKSWPNSNINLQVDSLRSTSEDLVGFFDQGTPAMLDSLGTFYYAGRFDGTIHSFHTNGNLVSEAGTLQTDIKMQFNNDFSGAEYAGDLRMESFDIGKVLGDTSMGLVSMEINTFGQGLNLDDLRATVLGEVQAFEYLGYTYRKLYLDGRIMQRKFVGTASIDDPNLVVDYEGVVNFADSNARFKFSAEIDTVNLTALNLYNLPFGLKGRVNSDFSGNDFNTMQGEVMISDLWVNNNFDQHHTDSIYIFSDNRSQTKRLLKINSPHINGELSGYFVPSQVPGLINQTINKYFPLRQTSAQLNADSLAVQVLEADQYLNFSLSLRRAGSFIKTFLPTLTQLDSLSLTGDISMRDQNSTIFGFLSRMTYDDMSFGPVTLTSIGADGVLDNVVTVSDARINDNLAFPYLFMDATVFNDTAYISALFQDRTSGGEKFSFAAMASRPGNLFKLELNEELMLNDEAWKVDSENAILFGSGQLAVENLAISKEGQSATVYTKTQSDMENLHVDFIDFDLAEIGRFLGVEEEFYRGQINGDITLQNFLSDPRYLADLKVDALSLKDEEIGDLVIQSRQRTADRVDLLLTLEGESSGVDLRGEYDLTNSNLSLQGEVDRLRVSSLDPFFEGLVHDSKGEVSGIIDIQGPISAPNINGNIEMDGVSTIIDYLQSKYTLENEEIEIVNNRFRFNNLTLRDASQNTAVINGMVTYNPEDMLLDVTVNTDRFRILNTRYTDNDLFYGTVFVGAEVQINGTTEAPKILINATTQDSTHFFMQPLGDDDSYAQEDFIIFANPKDFESDTSVSIQDLYITNEFGIDLTANLTLTKDALLEIIVDPLKGDKLVCRGDAELSVLIDPRGEVNVLGNYVISSGEYAFNFQGVLKRNFTIDPGSQVRFVGDPLLSRFDIKATYPVKTTTYELIRNQSTLSDREEALSRQRSDVLVKLNLSGNLERPEAHFDIEIPERSDAIAGSVTTKLQQLRENESDMNKQVFGLLILNSFIAEQQVTGSDFIAEAGESALLSSVSNLLTTELNKLAKRYIKGVDLDFGVGSYSTQANELVTELEVGLSKRLLNDRLQIRLGGNFQFDNQDDFELVSQQNATFSGDFVLEYKLTPTGNYNLKFFQTLSNEENVLSPGANYSETGIAILFSKTFNSKRYSLQLLEGDSQSSTKLRDDNE